MATEATVQVLDTSVDVGGLSAVSSTRTVANPRWGKIYDPLRLAAGVPIWFHPMIDGRYLGLFKTRWVEATSVYGTADLFSAHTEDNVATYVMIDPATGQRDGPYVLPGAPMACTFNGAFSRGEYIFITGLNDTTPWLWHYRLDRSGRLILQAEEQLRVGYGLGVYADGNNVVVFGALGGKLCRAKKNWGRIGVNTDTEYQWTYEGALGWYPDLDDAAAMATKDGAGVPAAGPCSVAKFRDRYYLSATAHQAGAYFAQIYTSRDVDSVWKPYADVIPLGDDSLYMSGGAYLQPQLVANKELVPDGASTGFAYVDSVKVTVSGNAAILTTWGMLTV